MFNAVELMIDDFIKRLRDGYRRSFGGQNPEYADIIAWAGLMAMENIANSDALYHNVEHSIHVTLVGQEMLRGRQLRQSGVTPYDWMHCIISLTCHDIGYVRGVCRADRPGEYATGNGSEMVKVGFGNTDAVLTPYHVDRGKLFIWERFGAHQILKADLIVANIELTRFPVPQSQARNEGMSYPNIVRAADLIGQLSDPRYLKKISALYYEFTETGAAKEFGYADPGDLKRHFPRFYWKTVYPYVKEVIPYLRLTQQGKQILANLHANIFEVEHDDWYDNLQVDPGMACNLKGGLI